MAATSYTTLPSSSYAGLGSQGDLYNSANYGTYDAGIGSITAHPYQYQTNNQELSSYPSTYATQQPPYYPTDRYAQQSKHNQDPTFNDYTSSQRYNTDQSTVPNMNDGNYPGTTTAQTKTDHHHPVESHNQHQTSHADATQHQPPVSNDDQHNSSKQQPLAKQRQQPQSNNARSGHQNAKNPSGAAGAQHRSPSNNGNDPLSATTTKATNPPAPELKTTKSSKMRAAAIKQKEETLDKKRKDGNFPATKKKSAPIKGQQEQQSTPSDDEQNDKKQPKRNKKQSHAHAKQHQSRHDHYHTEDNNSTADEDNHDRHGRSKSKKRAAWSDTHQEKYPALPPIRRGRGPPYYDSYYDYPYPSGHPLRGRYPYYEDYPYYPYYHHRRHLSEDNYDPPPYIASQDDPYDGFFDYEKHKSRSKSQTKTKSKTKKTKERKESPTTDREDHDGGVTGNETEHDDDRKTSHSKKSKNPKKSIKNDENEFEDESKQNLSGKYYDPRYYDDHYGLESWRQERNDYLKKKYKPTVHDVLYSQQWLKSDSYLENQRRRALRDLQGYYFPYKKYTLKDYKDLQKHESLQNPYAPLNNPPPDRKERAKKRQDYSTRVEKQMSDGNGGQHRTPRDMPPKKPWHPINGEPPHDRERTSKRERALEYAKVQVVKKRPNKSQKNREHETDPTEEYVNNLFPPTNHDDEGSADENDNQSTDNED